MQLLGVVGVGIDIAGWAYRHWFSGIDDQGLGYVIRVRWDRTEGEMSIN